MSHLKLAAALDTIAAAAFDLYPNMEYNYVRVLQSELRRAATAARAMKKRGKACDNPACQVCNVGDYSQYGKDTK